MSWIFNGNADFVELFWPFAFMGMSTVLLFGRVSTKTTSIVFYIYCILTVILIFQKGGADYLGGTSSRNSVSIFVVFFLTMHMVTSFQNKKSISIYYAFVAFITCFSAIGRSGVITSVIVICIFCIFRFEKGQSYIRNIKIFLGAVLATIVLYQLIMYFEPELIENAISNILWRGLESKRTAIWSDYVSKSFSSFGNWFFGSHISGTQLLNLYSENLHNSFLMLHAKYGMVVFLMVIILIIKSIVAYVKDRNFYFLSAMFICLFRMSFDYTNFNGLLDTIFLVLLLYPSYSKQVIKYRTEGSYYD